MSVLSKNCTECDGKGFHFDDKHRQVWCSHPDLDIIGRMQDVLREGVIPLKWARLMEQAIVVIKIKE